MDAEAALSGHEDFDLVLLDLKIPMDKHGPPLQEHGFSLLEHITAEYPHLLVYVFTAFDFVDYVVHAINLGARDYLTKPIALDVLREKLSTVLQMSTLRKQNAALRKEMDFGNIIGKSKPITSMLEMIKKVAPKSSTVLIQGPSGSGKELVAQALCDNSRYLTYHPINCAAIPKTLIESELFGHEKGSFTGASDKRKGLFEQANGGTVFLDEIGEMPLELQSKLLRFLEDRRFQRIGGEGYVKVDIRIVAATNRDITEMVREGAFREDLYYRLNVITITVPSLNDRPEDIPPLAQHFLDRFSDETQTLSLTACTKLKNHRWPGNVRELRNTIERSFILSEIKTVLEERDINFTGSGLRTGHPSVMDNIVTKTFKEAQVAMEKEYLKRVIDMCEGNKTKAIKHTEIEKSYFYKRIRKHGLS